MREHNSSTKENKLTFFEGFKAFLENILYSIFPFNKREDEAQLALPAKCDILESVEPEKPTVEVLVVNTKGNPYREPVHTEKFKQDFVPIFVEDEKQKEDVSEKKFAENLAAKLAFELIDKTKNYVVPAPKKGVKATVGKPILTTFFTCPDCQGRVIKDKEQGSAAWICKKCKTKGWIGEFSKKSSHPLRFYNEFIIHEEDES